jgi:hypothetical protein
VTRSIFAAAAASVLLTAAAGAQEEAAAPTTYVLAEDGSATHNETGAVCPGTIGDLVLAQVMSFDSEAEHFGIGCQYLNNNGFSSAISIFRTDQPDLVGPGDSAARWNNALYQILGSYPASLPANVAGLEGDEAQGLRGALFTANENGLPIRVGVWQAEKGDWQFRAQTTFIATSADAQWSLAEQTRAALIATKDSAH